MTTKREKAFAGLVKIHEKVEDEGMVRHLACVGDETDEAFQKRIEGLSPSLGALITAMRELDSMMPLERDIESGVWETLVLETADGRAWLGVENSIGKKDRLTTFIVHKDWARYVDQWSACREKSDKHDTPWDEARNERRTVNFMGEETTVDRGANFICDLLRKAGCEPFVSCEGHPRGAYFGYRGDADSEEALRNEFARLGWRSEVSNHGGSLAYMRPVETVEERDAEWRKLSMEFDYDIIEKSTPKP